MSQKHQRTRPESFRLNRQHPLNRGLVFAGLGIGVGSTEYYDSSSLKQRGTLFNMDPAVDWLWAPELNRFCCKTLAASSQYIDLGKPLLSGDFSVSFWLYPTTPGTFFSQYATGAAGRTEWYIGAANVYAIQIAATTDTNCGAVTYNKWAHISITRSGSTCAFYLNGLVNSAMMAAYNATQIVQTVNTQIARAGTSYGTTKTCDMLIHHWAIPQSYAQQLADPSNVMLSGLILAPRRRFWTTEAGAPPTFKPAWAAGKSVLIGGGIG